MYQISINDRYIDDTDNATLEEKDEQKDDNISFSRVKIRVGEYDASGFNQPELREHLEYNVSGDDYDGNNDDDDNDDTDSR